MAAVTPNDEINLLFVQKARDVGKVKLRFAALQSGAYGASTKMVHESGGSVLFGDEYDVERWMVRIREGEATVRELTAGSATTLGHGVTGARLAIPLVHKRGDSVRPAADDLDLKSGDVVFYAVCNALEEEAMTWLHSQGWQSA